MNLVVKSSFKKIFLYWILLILVLSVFSLTVNADDVKPDLTIVSIEMSSDEIYEGDSVEFFVEITNLVDLNGDYMNISSGTQVFVALEIDGIIVVQNYTDQGILAGENYLINLTWVADFTGSDLRDVSIIVDYPYPGSVDERDENNNIWQSELVVHEKKTELEIIDVETPDYIHEEESIEINVTIKNNGADTSQTVLLIFNSSVNETISKYYTNDSIKRDDTYIFNIEWIPSIFGSQTISFDLDYQNNTHDSYVDDIVVGVSQLEWWNSSWHYRFFISVTGQGNYSKFFNFTEKLESLGINNEDFENETIRLIKYSKDGEILEEIQTFMFNESLSYDKTNNATGILNWLVSGSEFEKYYCVYFDVEINDGARNTINETMMNASGNVTLSFEGESEGWWINVNKPTNDGYAFLLDPVDLIVETKSKADQVMSFIYYNENISHNYTVNLIDAGNQTWWEEIFNFDLEGNWTIEMSSSDKAGFSPNLISIEFFIGRPDLDIIDIKFTKKNSDSSIVHIDDIVNITGIVLCENASLEDVNVTLEIFDSDYNLIFTDYFFGYVVKDMENNIAFSWTANMAGEFIVNISVDSDELYNESDETNNNRSEEFEVLDWPDLKVSDIIIPSGDLYEKSNIWIDVIVKNIGLSDADDYEMRLYIESAEQEYMTYTNEKNSLVFSLDADEDKVFTIAWENAKSGSWMVGIQIITNQSKNDTDFSNNRLHVKTLEVFSVEKNPPVISNVKKNPTYPEYGQELSISAKVTDDTGLSSVVLKIKSTDNKYYSYIMKKTYDDQFMYIFDELLEVGLYSFEIIATDSTVHANNYSFYSNFSVFIEKEQPMLYYFAITPEVQLLNQEIVFECIVDDNIEIKSVDLLISPPVGQTYELSMILQADQKYVHTHTNEVAGTYKANLRVTDSSGNVFTSEDKYFYITQDLNDADNDGMPTDWEQRYNFNPYNSSDAKKDKDGDGYTNLREYEMGTHPTKKIKFENMAFNIRENALYLTLSAILFILILIISYYGKKRSD